MFGFTRVLAGLCAVFCLEIAIPKDAAAGSAGPIETVSAEQLAAFHHVALQSESGEAFAWSKAGAPPVLIVNWGSWCSACVAELPRLETLARRMGDRLRIILLSMPEHWDADRRYAHAHGLPFALYLPDFADPDERKAIRFSTTMADGRIVTPFPVTTLWTGDGRFVHGYIGSVDWNDESLVALMEDAS